MIGLIKRLFFWNYARNTWQWDVLCVVILVFIFLTPKSWFDNGERQSAAGHQTQAVSTVVIGAEVLDNAGDSRLLEERVRAISGKADAQVVAVRRRVGQNGKTLGYEVDIR